MSLKYDGDFLVVIETATNKFFPIRPDDIRAGEPGSLLSTFRKAEIEHAAERLALFFKSRGYWCGFSLEELRRFYQLNNWEFSNPFFGLIGAWFDDAYFGGWNEPSDVFIATLPDGTFFVTDRFILRCYEAADPTKFLETVDLLM